MSIIIAGYYGFQNAGDELILLSLIRQFRNQAPGVSIIVFSNSPQETQQAFGVGACDRWRPWTWVRPLLEAKRFILGGGGLLQESSGPWNHLYYLSLLIVAKIFGCRTEIKAIGVDPILDPGNRFLTRFVLDHWVDDISVRDSDSWLALRAAGVLSPIAIEPDPVASLRTARPREITRRIAFALSPSKTNPHWAIEVAQLCDHIGEEKEMEIDFLVFFPKEDEVFAREIVARLHARSRVRVWENPEELVSWIPEYSAIIATRFHALVLAATHKIPFVGWGSQNKLASFCRAGKRPYTNTEYFWDENEQFKQVEQLYQSPNKSVILATRTD